MVVAADGRAPCVPDLPCEQVVTRALADPPRVRGRPKPGVVAGEITLLPYRWNCRAGRRVGDAAAPRGRGALHGRRKARVRVAQDAAFRFMLALAIELPGYDDAPRALYAGERERFDAANTASPHDVRDYARELAAAAFGDDT